MVKNETKLSISDLIKLGIIGNKSKTKKRKNKRKKIYIDSRTNKITKN